MVSHLLYQEIQAIYEEHPRNVPIHCISVMAFRWGYSYKAMRQIIDALNPDTPVAIPEPPRDILIRYTPTIKQYHRPVDFLHYDLQKRRKLVGEYIQYHNLDWLASLPYLEDLELEDNPPNGIDWKREFWVFWKEKR